MSAGSRQTTSRTPSTIVNIGERAGTAPPDHRAAAVTALGFRDYAGAIRHLQLVLDEQPDDATAHYYLALAGLNGLHPDRLPTRRTDDWCASW